jgi:molybdopterin converting factor small subunit
MSIRIELYGRLRDAGFGDAMDLEWAGGTAGELLKELSRRLGPAAVGAVIGTEAEVLPSDAAVPEGARLAALPPVCGG